MRLRKGRKSPNKKMRAFKEHLNRLGTPKVPYATLEQAVEAANSETIRLGCFRMVPYLCSYCRNYHIGKPSYYRNEAEGSSKAV
jgi:hypothetical protein